MGVQAQEGATRSQSQRPPNRTHAIARTAARNAQLNRCVRATHSPGESVAGNRSDRRDAKVPGWVWSQAGVRRAC
eukprot:11455383-Alexandrium_andersonii.AAC.1